MKPTLSMNVRLFAFGAVMSTLVGAGILAPSIKGNTAAEPMVSAVPSTVVVSGVQPAAISAQPATEVAQASLVPQKASADILELIFNFILALLGLA